MKYLKIYGNSYKDLEQIPETELIYVTKPGRCTMCDEATNFIDMNYQTFICSEECTHLFEAPLDYDKEVFYNETS